MSQDYFQSEAEFHSSQCEVCWFKMAPNFYEGTSAWPTAAYSEAWRGPAQPGAQPEAQPEAQPWRAWGVVRRRRARSSPPVHNMTVLSLSTRCFLLYLLYLVYLLTYYTYYTYYPLSTRCEDSSTNAKWKFDDPVASGEVNSMAQLVPLVV